MIEVTDTPGTELAEVTFTRDFDAPREMVFRALMEPEQLVHFWGPVGTSVPLASVIIEPWAGGRFENVIVTDDGSETYPFKSVFVDVLEPERFTFKELSGITSTSTFTDLGTGRTRLVIHQTDVPFGYRTPEALAGFSTTLDLLAEHLAKQLGERS
jgi:uncharacterized protein YndB with AHSA1/START domain